MPRFSAIAFAWVFLFSEISLTLATAASGMFPKMPAAPHAYVVHCGHDSEDARMTAMALQGLVNQSSAEVYLISSDFAWEQIKNSEKPYSKLTRFEGDDAGLRTLFKQYQSHVKKIFLYDPQKDWTRYLAVMAGAQQGGVPATEAVKDKLASEFGWGGEVVDFRNRWQNRIEAYDWALANLMPGCSKKVLFGLKKDMPLFDYVVASKGFVFWLTFKNDAERAEAEKIFQTKGYGVGTSLMGYASTGDAANRLINKYGIGYVVSDYYGNGSFWSSFPNKTYTQRTGGALVAQPGKIYVAFGWTDGDNIQFDQNALYNMWRDPARGSVPVGISLAPALQELDTPLLDWYYKTATPRDELMAGPCGFQFIYGNNYNEALFPEWCRMNHDWLSGAGFRTASFWCQYPSSKWTLYAKTCGLVGVANAGEAIGGGFNAEAQMPIVEGLGAGKEEEIFQKLSKVVPKQKAPLFMGFGCNAAGFVQSDGQGYSKIKRQVAKLQATYPGRFVFLLPKDLFATMRNYYHLPQVP